MAEFFPPTLAGVKIASLSVTEQPATRSDDSEIGPATYQLLSIDGPTIFSVQWLFFPIDFMVFEGWYRHTLQKGANSFIIDLPVGAGLQSHECNFVGSYTSTQQGRLFLVTANLRAIAKVFNTEDDFDELLVLVNAIPEKNKLPLVNSTLQFVSVLLPGIWQDIDFGTDNTDIDDQCALLTSSIPGPHDFDFGITNAPFDTTSTAVVVNGCVAVSWTFNVSIAPTSIELQFTDPTSPSDLYNIYVFDAGNNLVGKVIGVLITTGTVFFRFDTNIILGSWVIVVTGRTTSDRSSAGLKCRLIVA